ncbi:MAG: DUF1272 domain-containing protein [Saprospiraceae bacterium]|nr:DUF1272 domain-containing protein [Saprospiraceae bacterium]
MLKLKPTCENCNTSLPPESVDAMICSFECTFCKDCVEQVLENVCPNCGGEFQPRPIRPKSKLDQYPASKEVYFKPVDLIVFKEFKSRIGKP